MPSTAELAPQQPVPATRNALVALLVKALRPLVVLMLRHGLTAYEFAEISRWVFAHVAMDRKQFAVRGRDVWSMTKSRAAVLTGLTRREVDRLVCMQAPAVDEARKSFHRSARILTAWTHEDGYQDRNGKPGDLPIKGGHGSLEWLVRHYCRDIPVRAMLDELVDRGCVERIDREHARFVHAHVGGPPLSMEDLDRLSQLAGHFMALINNALNESDDNDKNIVSPHFIEMTAGPVAREHREALCNRITETMNTFAVQMNRELSAHPKSLMTDNSSRMVVGLYNGFL